MSKKASKRPMNIDRYEEMTTVENSLVDHRSDPLSVSPYMLRSPDTIVVHENIENKVRSFTMYKALYRALEEFIESGEGLNTLPVFEEEYFPDSDTVDVTMKNFIRLLATAFGRAHIPMAMRIVDRMERTNARKHTFRFRSRHPLFVYGESRDQNICLVSGMVHLGIPILPYFDGKSLLPYRETGIQPVSTRRNRKQSDLP